MEMANKYFLQQIICSVFRSHSQSVDIVQVEKWNGLYCIIALGTLDIAYYSRSYIREFTAHLCSISLLLRAYSCCQPQFILIHIRNRLSFKYIFVWYK